MNTAGLILIVVVIGLVYGLMIVPQRKQQKAKQNMVKQLTPGTKILTAGGIYATVRAVTEKSILVRIGHSEGLEVDLDPRAVLRVVEESTSVVQPELSESSQS